MLKTEGTISLTEKEQKAFIHIVKISMYAMGGEEPKDLHDDNYSWHGSQDIQDAGFTQHQAAGLMSALEAKNLTYDNEMGKGKGPADWAVSDNGIDFAQILFEKGLFKEN